MSDHELHRRTALALAAGVSLAGCLADEEPGDDGSTGGDADASAADDGDGESAGGPPGDETSDDADSDETDASGDGDADTTGEESDSTADEPTHLGDPASIAVGPDGELVFEPSPAAIDVGTTVAFEWGSDTHNVTPTSIPEDAAWDGEPEIHDTGHVYEHTFEVPGRYEFQCDPHASAGMTGELVVGGAPAFGGTVVTGPNGRTAFSPDYVEVEPGTTVRFEWDSDHHNVVPVSIPEDAEWEGHPEIEERGHAYEYTFEVPGTYEYECEPHAVANMEGTIVVTEE